MSNFWGGWFKCRLWQYSDWYTSNIQHILLAGKASSAHSVWKCPHFFQFNHCSSFPGAPRSHRPTHFDNFHIFCLGPWALGGSFSPGQSLFFFSRLDLQFPSNVTFVILSTYQLPSDAPSTKNLLSVKNKKRDKAQGFPRKMDNIKAMTTAAAT